MFESDLTDAHLQAIRQAITPFMGTELVEFEHDEWAGWCRSWVGVQSNSVLIMMPLGCSTDAEAGSRGRCAGVMEDKFAVA